MSGMNEPEKMEEWMNTWQQNTESLKRDDYLKKMWSRRLQDYLNIAVLFGVRCVLIWKALANTNFIFRFAAIVFVPYMLLAAWKAIGRIRLEVFSLPLSSKEYLDAVGHNLRLREGDAKWDRRTLLPMLLAVFFVLGWAAYDVGTLPIFITTGVISIIVIPIAIYWTFSVVPKKLTTERLFLDRLVDDADLL